VDIVQISVLEFTDRPDSPLFHLEHFIDGQYIKYNSNSGFVEVNLRLTPQVRLLDIGQQQQQPFYKHYVTAVDNLFHLGLEDFIAA